ncbi:hypothetical protein RHCRD62_40061 [Rhodococcus sp. RD6.2]|nr:hypothetical protein RHCRD62_40061 [Rhodococcus sp. RD6.2]
MKPVLIEFADRDLLAHCASWQ